MLLELAGASECRVALEGLSLLSSNDREGEGGREGGRGGREGGREVGREGGRGGREGETEGGISIMLCRYSSSCSCTFFIMFPVECKALWSFMMSCT